MKILTTAFNNILDSILAYPYNLSNPPPTKIERSLVDFRHVDLVVNRAALLALADVRQRLVLAALQPAAPVLEAVLLEDTFGAGDVVADVVVEEVLAALVTDAAGPTPAAPLVALDLEDPVRVDVAARPGHQPGVQAALALHQANPVADERPGDLGFLQLFHRLAFGEDLAVAAADNGRQEEQHRQPIHLGLAVRRTTN